MEKEILIAMIIGILVVIGGLLWLKKIKKRKTSCTSSCEGEVVEINRHIDRDEDGDKIMYSPVFGYEVNGTNYTHAQSSSSSNCRYKVGDKVTVFYNPQNPNESRIKGNHADTAGAVMLIVMGMFLLIVGFLNILS